MDEHLTQNQEFMEDFFLSEIPPWDPDLISSSGLWDPFPSNFDVTPVEQDNYKPGPSTESQKLKPDSKERNRQAAFRYRRKKADTTNGLEKKVKDLEQMNLKLKQELQLLHDERFTIKNAILGHVDQCAVPTDTLRYMTMLENKPFFESDWFQSQTNVTEGMGTTITESNEAWMNSTWPNVPSNL